MITLGRKIGFKKLIINKIKTDTPRANDYYPMQ